MLEWPDTPAAIASIGSWGVPLTAAATPLGLGLRHGLDVDHLTAIADLVGSAGGRRRGLSLAFWYIAGHAVVVATLGLLALAFNVGLPAGLDAVLQRVVGATLIVLGLGVVASLVRQGRRFRLRSRWALLARALGRRGDHPPAHAIERDARVAVARPGPAIAIGVLHGLGAETPTQLAVLALAAGAGGLVGGMAFLAAFVVGLVLANGAVALASSGGVLDPDRGFRRYAIVSVVVALCSLGAGFSLAFGSVLAPS